LPSVTVRCPKVTEYGDWDGFVAQSPQGTLFHKSYWLEASGGEFRIYGYFKGGELFAGMPLACGVSRLGFKRAFHPPLTPYLGVIFRESEAKYVKRLSDEKQISRDIAGTVKADFDSIHFRFTPFSTDLQPFIWAGFSSGVRYTYLLELDDLVSVWEGMDESRRRNIRRAERDGIYVESGANFEQTFALVEKTFQRQEKEAVFKSAAFKYNEALSQTGQCNSFLARDKEGKAIAAVYIVWDEKRSYYILGGYDVEERHHGASAIAMWEAIKFTKEKLGLNQFDFEGSMIPPVEQFFRKFGGRLTPYYSVSWMRPSVRAVSYAGRLVRGGLRRLHL
jgi:hypothetical protein